VVAGLSDGIDGLLARKLNQRSSLGAYLDPIADKLLLSLSFRDSGHEEGNCVVAHNYCAESRHSHPGGRGGNYFDFRLPPISSERPWKATTMLQIVLVFTIVLAAAYPNLPLARTNEFLIYGVTALATVSAFTIPFRSPATEFAGAAKQLSLGNPSMGTQSGAAKPGRAADRDSAKS